MFLALLRARSMTALSFWFTWMATLCWAPAAGLLGLLWAACLVCAKAGAPAIAQPERAVAAATTNARLLERAMVIAYSLDPPSERRRQIWLPDPSVNTCVCPRYHCSGIKICQGRKGLGLGPPVGRGGLRRPAKGTCNPPPRCSGPAPWQAKRRHPDPHAWRQR